jgi:hypothetical protein
MRHLVPLHLFQLALLLALGFLDRQRSAAIAYLQAEIVSSANNSADDGYSVFY